MIAAKEFDPQQVRRAYNRRSWIYSKTMAEMEWSYHLVALDQAQIQPGEKILEVAVGPGLTLVELARRVGAGYPVYGMDLSSSMLEMTRQRMSKNGFTNAVLKEGDCRSLPFEDNRFDMLYNGYMLDLIPERDMPQILSEYLRVLLPGGRLVLLNMSKPDDGGTPREWLYQHLPAKLVLYLMGACRPVLMEKLSHAAGFERVARTYLGGKAPSEIVVSSKPNTN
jgi:demethylmenaquinone methyltransferase/2-methoxy-6-polyprenyl-1,4-benzoquinol methylase